MDRREFTEDEDRQLATKQAGYWVQQFQEQGDPRWVQCWILWQIAKVLWRIFDKLEEIYRAVPETSDIRDAIHRPNLRG